MVLAKVLLLNHSILLLRDHLMLLLHRDVLVYLVLLSRLGRLLVGHINLCLVETVVIILHLLLHFLMMVHLLTSVHNYVRG